MKTAEIDAAHLPRNNQAHTGQAKQHRGYALWGHAITQREASVAPRSSQREAQSRATKSLLWGKERSAMWRRAGRRKKMEDGPAPGLTATDSASKTDLTDEPSISTEMPDETLLVAANLAQPGEIEMSVSMRRVKVDASLIGRFRSVIAFQFFENHRPVEVQ